jgi:hypothetical protein
MGKLVLCYNCIFMIKVFFKCYELIFLSDLFLFFLSIEIHKEAMKSHKETCNYVIYWMELEIIMLTEINWDQKAKYHMVSLIYGIQT